MSVRLFLLERYLPAAIRRRMIDGLVRATAGAFGVPAPAAPSARGSAFVEAYAEFTRREVERVRSDGSAAEAVQHRLYEAAREMGRSVRRHAGIRTPGEAMRALRLLYREIGIDVEADPAAREVIVRRCAFSARYAPEVCRFVSALDAGMVHGLTGDSTIEFAERITEGAACCRARLMRVAAS
jgi:predicted ArsR family transcriptional regulator